MPCSIRSAPRASSTDMAGQGETMNRVGIIGHGRIARRVIDAFDAGAVGRWELCGILARSTRREGAHQVFGDVDAFLGTQPSLIIEAAGPAALAQYGERALAAADVWTISAMALADPDLHRRLEATGMATGHRLRLLSGAFCGLDGVLTAAVDPDMTLKLTAAVQDDPEPAEFDFVGTAREVGLKFEGVNILVAAALAGPGLDETTVSYVKRKVPWQPRLYKLDADSKYAHFTATAEPRSSAAEGTKCVSASVIAALRQAGRTIWVG